MPRKNYRPKPMRMTYACVDADPEEARRRLKSAYKILFDATMEDGQWRNEEDDSLIHPPKV
jgi:hypothetical protein